MMYFVPEGCIIIINSVDLDEMQDYAAFHLGLHCLPKYPFYGFQYTIGVLGFQYKKGFRGFSIQRV